MRDETPLEARLASPLQMTGPVLEVNIQNVPGALLRLASPQTEGIRAGGFDLRSNELGAVGLAVLLQPVSEHQVRGVIVRVGVDRGQ